jgi:putative transposase
MARLARVVAPGLPHHVTQRGNRRQRVFFDDGDYRLYRDLLAEQCAAARVEVWGYCLMPNHVHLILVPRDRDGLSAALSVVHKRYTRHVNARKGWTGYLWQGRFASFVMSESHLVACARYVEMNPVRAGLVDRPRDWPWSSARAHLAGRDDGLVTVAPLLDMVTDWRALLDDRPPKGEWDDLRAHTRTGRPLGEAGFVAGLERKLGRVLGKRKPGRQPRAAGGKGRGGN